MPRRALAAATAITLVAAGLGLYLFQPWRAFTTTIVDEALPTATSTAPATVAPMMATPTSMVPAPQAPATPSVAPATPVDLARGRFVSGEHETTGTVRLVRLADGSTVLRLESLSTSEGPDVRVYLSARPASESRLDDLGAGAIELDRLKGNRGNQNYPLPAGVDLAAVHSVVIWCKRFSVGFGAADLAGVPS
ncbi:DM13 domain-containing protein [Kitasatospora purpeofusca]|uniref:DM13 domain-containing protein n=1 Tax=Kitasatospora purpeofusca TaxID=67352 RepID=UPI00224F2147|nr:DM13 domain-containing protein [Kitasatospora purpeofusca]MCX4758621.1 DM13 domain-containing protein [Kitasatospora purpeofusca]